METILVLVLLGINSVLLGVIAYACAIYIRRYYAEKRYSKRVRAQNEAQRIRQLAKAAAKAETEAATLQ